MRAPVPENHPDYLEWDIPDTPQERWLRNHLKPVQGFRAVYPHCCATCAYLKPGNGWAKCLRPAEEGKQAVNFDLGDGKHYFSVCNRYKSDKANI